MIAKMIIPTFILSGWRYLIIFDFFFFANALFLPAVSGICCARNYVPGESPHSYRHTNSRGEPSAPAVKIVTKIHTMYYRETTTSFCAFSGISAASMEMLNTKFTLYFSLIPSNVVMVSLMSSPSKPASFKKLSKNIVSIS